MKFTDANGSTKDIQAVWIEQEHLPNVYFIDQRFIPFKVAILTSKSVRIATLKGMVIRGAPSIGAAAAYGMLQSYIQHNNSGTQIENMQQIEADAKLLLSARPTAVDLQNSVSEMLKIIREKNTFKDVLNKAKTITADIISECLAIAAVGGNLIKNGSSILHHCHTGALATVDIGTALGILIQAYKSGKQIHVYVDETRPRLQGGRITAWELNQEQVPHTIISDSVAASLMRQGKIDLIMVGADRVASNGDIANKIGTYSLAVLAYHHQIPFYCAIPWSTFDRSIASGDEIIIEQRDESEVRRALTSGLRTEQIINESPVYNPAFDVTPNNLITGIITPKTIIQPPYKENIAKVLDHDKT